jgi:hypothetical protein
VIPGLLAFTGQKGLDPSISLCLGIDDLLFRLSFPHHE